MLVETQNRAHGLTKRNDELTEENRRILDEHGVMGIDLLGGSGKAALIEALAGRLKGKDRITRIKTSVKSGGV